MTAYVLDTSVAIAWYLPEAFSVAAREWQRKLLAEQVEFFVPGLHFWEFGNVLRTYLRRGELEADIAHEVYDTHLEAPLTVVEPNRRAVLDCATEYESTVYDAVYIRLALDLDATMLTAERSTTPWVVKLGQQLVTVAAG